VALPPGLPPLAALVSESASRVLVAVAPEASGDLTTLAAEAGVPATRLGATGGDRLVVPGLLDLPLSHLRDAYEGALPRALGELA
ncbi:MAG: purL, partial [Actinomycetia bacterium]|nr:purL [Actinomycetes bacterium]